MLARSSQALVREHDLIALDLDGVVYIGNEAVPNAAEALAEARKAGAGLAFVTNNASRTPAAVAAHLSALGIKADTDDVVTSAQAAATLLRDGLPEGAQVYVIGGQGLEVALTDVGLVPVFDAADQVEAVVQGYGPEMPWKRVVAGAILVEEGRLWIATNMDRTIPTSVGVGPGNGARVDLVARFSGRTPIVAGKPEAPLLHEVERRHAAQKPLFVGDRLDTDMAGAHNVGWPSLLVRTGVTTLRDLVAAPTELRPQFIAHDLMGLHVPHPVPTAEGDSWVLGGWRARVDGARRLVVEGSGSDDDWWRCAVEAAWAYADAQGSYPQADTVNVDEVRPPR